jgi:hypothetical protein
MRSLFKIFLFGLITLTSLTANSWQEPDEKHTIYVSSISWHTGIVIPVGTFPEKYMAGPG